MKCVEHVASMKAIRNYKFCSEDLTKRDELKDKQYNDIKRIKCEDWGCIHLAEGMV
jgi:hypothetical protein